MPTETPTLKSVPSAPIGTLAELRGKHSAFLQRRVSGDPQARPSPGEILGFLEAASAAGRRLSSPDERESATSILDYWITNLVSQAPEAANISRPFYLEAFDEATAGSAGLAAAAARESCRQAAQRAEEKAAKYSTNELENLHLIFARLAWLKKGSLQAYAIPMPADAGLLDEPGIRPMIKELIETGVLIQRPGGDGTGGDYILAYEALLTDWKSLSEFLNHRKAFRELAKGWERSGRAKAALLSRSRQLEAAVAYRDRDDVEAAYISAGQRQNTEGLGIVALITLAVVAALSFLAIRLYVTNVKLTSAIEKYSQAAKTALSAAEVAESAAERARTAQIAEKEAEEKAEVALTQQITRNNESSAQVQALQSQIAALKQNLSSGAVLPAVTASLDRIEGWVKVLDLGAKLNPKIQDLQNEVLQLKQSLSSGAILPTVTASLEHLEQSANALDLSAKQNSQQSIDSARLEQSVTGRVQLPAMTVLAGASGTVSEIRFTGAQPPEVVAGTTSERRPGATYLWNLEGRVLHTLAGDAGRVRISPDAQWILTVPWSKSFHAWSRSDDWRKDHTLGSGLVSVAVFSPDGKTVAVGTDGTLELWDWGHPPASKSAWRDSAPSQQRITSIAFTKSGQRLGTSGDDKTFRIYELQNKDDLAAGAKIWRQEALSDAVAGLVVSPNDQWLLARLGNEIDLYPLAQATDKGVQCKHDSAVFSSEFSPDNQWVASVVKDGSLYLWHLDAAAGWKLALHVKAHGQPANAVAWSPDGRYLATVGDDAKALIWDVSTFAPGAKIKPAMDLRGFASTVNAVQFSADSRYLAVGGGPTARLWDFHTMLNWNIGRIKTFGGPGDAGATVDEGLALVANWNEADASAVFLPNADRKSSPRIRDLNPDKYYIAARWDYNATPRKFLVTHKIRVANLRTGVEVEAQPVDWGPSESSGSLMDLSPALARALGLNVGDEAAFAMPPPSSAANSPHASP